MLNRLPEREQNHELHRCDFAERLVFNKAILQLHVKLDLAEHRTRHAATSYEHDLHILAKKITLQIKDVKPKDVQTPDA